MAGQEASQSTLGVRQAETRSRSQKPLFVGLPTLWKAMIITSFILNMILLATLLIAVGFFLQWRAQLDQVVVKGFARQNVVELREVVQNLQDAHIKTTIPLDQPLPVDLVVPIDQTTLVTTTTAIPINVPAAIDMGPFGQLHPNVSLNLPAGTPLLIQLKLDVPLKTTIPVKLDVPVDIAMADTELAPQFKRLGDLVDRLVYPVAPLLDLDIPPPTPAPAQSRRAE